MGIFRRLGVKIENIYIWNQHLDEQWLDCLGEGSKNSVVEKNRNVDVDRGMPALEIVRLLQ